MWSFRVCTLSRSTLLSVNVDCLQLLQRTLSFPGCTNMQLLQYTKKVLRVRTPIHKMLTVRIQILTGTGLVEHTYCDLSHLRPAFPLSTPAMLHLLLLFLLLPQHSPPCSQPGWRRWWGVGMNWGPGGVDCYAPPWGGSGWRRNHEEEGGHGLCSVLGGHNPEKRRWS